MPARPPPPRGGLFKSLQKISLSGPPSRGSAFGHRGSRGCFVQLNYPYPHVDSRVGSARSRALTVVNALLREKATAKPLADGGRCSRHPGLSVSSLCVRPRRRHRRSRPAGERDHAASHRPGFDAKQCHERRYRCRRRQQLRRRQAPAPGSLNHPLGVEAPALRRHVRFAVRQCLG